MDREKKNRGKRRKFRNIKNNIAEWSQSLPVPPDKSPNYLGYRAYSFATGKDFGDYSKFHKKHKREIMQLIINFVKILHDLKSENEKEYRIICLLPLPDLHQPFVMIGYTKAGLESFYNGLNYDGEFLKKFSLSEDDQFLQTEWGVTIPNGLKVKGFNGKDECIGDSMWFVGNIE
ncbi:hypothetical protein ABE65_017725 [Fictibacillus phosphorivorans]|uniref:DUF3916 domain-containing protein n=1 Tax=Fictibacillus phosphorivorans TaxID=1221500 RepID=A0A168W8G6_9BACL|nr:DUF3916 domain-containing protein [Fictibacillus phosphorivorans]ANC78539.1 hypothetical protein ABE65_017725 [Fictibacillus phosphorivorans]